MLPCGLARAAPVELYSGEAEVADQGTASRAEALPRALEQVLRKLTGLASFDDHPVVEPALRRAPSMLLSFHYRNIEWPLADGSSESHTRLVARFSPVAVDELLRTLELPLWRPERSEVELWPVIDDGLDRRILPVEYEYTRAAMEAAAADRGLPIAWPQPDDNGQYTTDLQLLWGGYTEELLGDGRYAAMILAARREGVEWSVRVNLSYRDQSWAWRLQAIDLQAAFAEGVQQAADRIAEANSIAATDLGAWKLELTVSGIRGFQDYQRCLAYLQGISIVERVDVTSARAAEVDFSLQLSAAPRYLEESLATGGVLESAGPGSYTLISGALDER
jgi:hypothetical protein